MNGENIKIQSAFSLIPPTHYKFSAVKEGELSYGYYEVRHPGAIFSMHLQDIFSAFNALSFAVANLQATGGKCSDEEAENLQSLTLSMLFSLINYFESGYEIFLCYCDQHTKPVKNKPLYQWLNSNGYQNEISAYFSNIDPLIGTYRNFFNALKHSSNRIMNFQFLKPDGTQKVMGFYLEGVNDKGVIGPIVEFHSMYDDMFTAWSYNFHLYKIYFLIYKIASEMGEAVERICKKRNMTLSIQNPTLVNTGVEKVASEAYSTMQRFYRAFNTFYPQEYDEKAWICSADLVNEQLIFAEKIFTRESFSGWPRILMTKGDGFSRSWSLIYSKGQK